MIQSIKSIFQINTHEELIAARDQFEEELTAKLQPLVDNLEHNILSTDVASMEQHMCYIEKWRVTVIKYLSFASAFTDHAKDSTFMAAKFVSDDNDKKIKVSETERDAQRRKLSGGFAAMQVLLEGLIDSIDSRVNLSKKMLGIEVDTPYKKGH